MYSNEKSLPDILKDLAARHSYTKLHTELIALMKDEYAALKAFFEVDPPKKRRGHQPPLAHDGESGQAGQAPLAPSEAPAVQVEEELERPSPKLLANTKIRIIKKAASPEPVVAVEEQQKVRMDSKELKAWQKEQEGKKLAELTAAGTNPETLLTPESIKRWVEDEGRTFAYVAREYVGLPEATVADFAKTHGVKSKISKTRAILSAKNRRPA